MHDGLMFTLTSLDPRRTALSSMLDWANRIGLSSRTGGLPADFILLKPGRFEAIL
jgi:hypothetical protein